MLIKATMKYSSYTPFKVVKNKILTLSSANKLQPELDYIFGKMQNDTDTLEDSLEVS